MLKYNRWRALCLAENVVTEDWREDLSLKQNVVKRKRSIPWFRRYESYHLVHLPWRNLSCRLIRLYVKRWLWMMMEIIYSRGWMNQNIWKQTGRLWRVTILISLLFHRRSLM